MKLYRDPINRNWIKKYKRKVVINRLIVFAIILAVIGSLTPVIILNWFSILSCVLIIVAFDVVVLLLIIMFNSYGLRISYIDDYGVIYYRALADYLIIENRIVDSGLFENRNLFGKLPNGDIVEVYIRYYVSGYNYHRRRSLYRRYGIRRITIAKRV